MILNKALLIKGLVGTTSVLGIGTGAYFGKDHISELFRTNKEGNDSGEQKAQPQEQEISETELIKKVGLDCNTPSATGTDCSKVNTEGSKINIKQSEETSGDFEIDTLPTGNGSGKIKLYKLSGQDTGYHKGLKFVIEDGNITKDNKTLEQFETYEIKKEENENKYYLKRKDKAGKKIKELLGLPDGCSLTDDNNGCSEVDVDTSNIGKIKFDGLGESQTASINGSSRLTVSKENTTDSDFPFGYKFIFKATGSNVSITLDSSKTISLDTSKGTEFKIKKSGNNITLEEAWTLDTLLGKVGLSGCTATNQDCTIGNSGLSVKQGDSNKEKSKTKESNNGGSGKIKVYKENSSTDYNKGFKFVIEDGDINFGSSTGNTISKLEQFETYEIKKEDSSSDWYLTRKKDALEEKKRILGLPADDESCKLPTDSETSTCCNLDATKLKAINFEGKNSSGTPTIGDSKKVTITISKTSDSPFTEGGYKFLFTSEGEVSIPKDNSETISIKKGTNTEFKIKKEGNKLTLEKAWTADALAKKAGLTGCDTGSKECTLPTDNKLKLNNGDSDKVTNAKSETADQKIKYQENVEGHNQGIKFYVENEVTLAESKKIEKDNVTYEIKEESGTWYLTKKSNGASS